jgi:hypothetical protein
MHDALANVITAHIASVGTNASDTPIAARLANARCFLTICAQATRLRAICSKSTRRKNEHKRMDTRQDTGKEPFGFCWRPPIISVVPKVCEVGAKPQHLLAWD